MCGTQARATRLRNLNGPWQRRTAMCPWRSSRIRPAAWRAAAKSFSFRRLAWPAASVNGIESLWLTLRLRHGLDAVAVPGSLHGAHRASLRLAFARSPPRARRALSAACHETMPLDISKDFFPFGERPRFGAVFQLLCPAFGEAGARVEILVRLTNPEGATAAPIPPVSREGQPHVVWEIATTSGFQAIAANDGTQSLTQDGSVVFTVPNDVAAVPIAGKTGTWLRARLASGHYGSMPATDGTAILVMRAPSVKSVAVRSTLERGPLPPEHLVSAGRADQMRSIRTCLAHGCVPVARRRRASTLHRARRTRRCARRVSTVLAKGCVISWHVRPTPTRASYRHTANRSRSSVALQWQMRSGDGWRDITVHDDSAGLTRSGIVKLTLQDEPSQWPGNVLDPPARVNWRGCASCGLRNRPHPACLNCRSD